MGRYLIRRLVYMIFVVWASSVIIFFVIQLPPGDYLTSYIISQERQGRPISEDEVDSLRQFYGLDRTPVVQYALWVTGFFTGDLGKALSYNNQPVADLIWDRVALTALISLGSILFTWVLAFPVGVYSALRQYSVGDYTFSFLSFLGLSIPNFMLALVLMYVSFKYFGTNVGGLFSPEFVDAPWSFAKLADLLGHLWIPLVVLGTAGTAGLVRTLRANLLDEKEKLYVKTAIAKGLTRRRAIWKYAVRIALNPFFSSIGSILPALISGATITSVVLNLPTTGPMLLNALLSQDMYFAGSFLMLLTILSLVGILISDIILAIADPRIRYY